MIAEGGTGLNHMETCVRGYLLIQSADSTMLFFLEWHEQQILQAHTHLAHIIPSLQMRTPQSIVRNTIKNPCCNLIFTSIYSANRRTRGFIQRYEWQLVGSRTSNTKWNRKLVSTLSHEIEALQLTVWFKPDGKRNCFGSSCMGGRRVSYRAWRHKY